MKEYVAGIDVGGTTIKMAFFPEDGAPVAKWEIVTPVPKTNDDFFRPIAESIFQKAEELSIPRSSIMAIGMGLPAPIPEGGYMPKCANIGLDACNPAETMTRLTGIPSFVTNDANAAALGETTYGAANGVQNVVMITLGTGIGGGIVVNGRIVNGKNGVAGEIGHIVVNPEETEPCNCGNRGCVEQYASATGIVRTARQLLGASDRPSALRSIEKLTAKDVVDAAKQGDEIASETMEFFGKMIGLLISYLMLTVDPEVVLIGGGVSKGGQYIVDLANKYTFRNTHIAEKTGEIRLSALGNDAGIYGAAALARQSLKKE